MPKNKLIGFSPVAGTGEGAHCFRSGVLKPELVVVGNTLEKVFDLIQAEIKSRQRVDLFESFNGVRLFIGKSGLAGISKHRDFRWRWA